MAKHRVVRHAVTQPSDSSYRLIPLTQGQNAIVDTFDYNWLTQWNWYARWDEEANTFYALRKNPETIYMHREIVGAIRGEYVDHRDHCGLNNRRLNLRKCTQIENSENLRKSTRNTSGFKGVSWNKGRRRWVAQIRINKQLHYIGHFHFAVDAALAYDVAARKHFGEFALLNFPVNKG